ncbi:MAG: MlaD family protein [Candidatus Babeliales bacterium]|nr:MlaD family protein [Candidatus Babeliales bacterium]
MQLKTETKVGLFVLMAISLFAYMALYLGVFRLYVKNYNAYNLYFDDLSGLAIKADVKIAGVKVGWIDDVKLIENGTQAKVSIALKQHYVLYKDAHAEIQQEALLGNKFLEILPGNSRSGIIKPGEDLVNKVESLVSVEHLIKKLDNIAVNMKDLTHSLKNVLSPSEQQEHLRSIIKNVNQITSKISVFCDLLAKNEKNFDLLINNLKTVSQDLIPVCEKINKVSEKLYTDTLPSLENNFQRISDVVDRDFNRVATRFDSTMEHCQSVAKKIDDGDGLLGKFVNGFWKKKKKTVSPELKKKTSDPDNLTESEVVLSDEIRN